MLKTVFLILVVAKAKLKPVPGISLVKLQSQDGLNSL